MKKIKAVFLDRDGTINDDPGYISDPKVLKLLPGVGEALRLLKDAEFKLVVVTNQSGIGRGFFTEDDLRKVHARMNELLDAFGAPIDDYRYCIHQPADRCPCRKPGHQLILDSARDHDIDLSRSFMIGDRDTDIFAGKGAGVKTIGVRTGKWPDIGEVLSPGIADYIADDLEAAARWILSISDR